MADRESNDLFFGYPEPETPEPDETGMFAVRTVYRDGVERFADGYTSLRAALEEADDRRKRAAADGYDRLRIHVAVIDMNDPERGSLDWDALDGLPS